MAITLNRFDPALLPNPRPGQATLFYNLDGEPRVRYADGTEAAFKGETGATGAQGPKGDPGPQGQAGADGIDGADGSDGFTLLFGTVVDGERRVRQVDTLIDITNGTVYETDPPGLPFPLIGQYEGPDGLVGTAAQATDIRGAQGATGAQGDPGPQGDPGLDGDDGASGYTVEEANVIDGARVVRQVVAMRAIDGVRITTNPPGFDIIGRYVGPLGYTANIANATDVRGPQGPAGSGGGGTGTAVYKTNTVAYSNNQIAPGSFVETTDINHMLEPNAVYRFRINVGWSPSSTGGMRYQVDAPNGSFLEADGVIQSQNSTGSNSAVTGGSPSADGTNTFRLYATTNGGTGQLHQASAEGTVRTGANAGTLSFKFGSSSTGTTITIPVGHASLLIERIS